VNDLVISKPQLFTHGTRPTIAALVETP